MLSQSTLILIHTAHILYSKSISVDMSEVKTYVFFVYAPDYTDPDAFNRRLSVRSQHLERMGTLGKKGILSTYCVQSCCNLHSIVGLS